MNAVLRDRRIGQRLAFTGGARILQQGAIASDNRTRKSQWSARYALVPLESTITPIKRAAK